MARVLLVRHGETTWNRDGLIQGWADSTLTERGRRQAAAVGERLAGLEVDRLVVSDLQRTRETAAAVREAGIDADPVFERAWRERSFGEYQGLTRSAVAAREAGYDPDGSLVAVESVPGGESRAEFVARVEAGFRELVGGLASGETAVVVTHGGPIRVAVAAVTGADLPALAREWSPSNCGVTEIDVGGGDADAPADDGPALVRRDDTAHLD